MFSTEKIEGQTISFKIDKKAIVLFGQVMNEVLNGIHVQYLGNQKMIDKNKISMIANYLNNISLTEESTALCKFTIEDLIVIKHCFCAVINDFWGTDYHTRLGVRLDDFFTVLQQYIVFLEECERRKIK